VKCLEKGFGPKTHTVTREMRRLHNEELYDVYVVFSKYYSGDQIKNNEMPGERSTYGKHERCIQGFGGQTGEKYIILKS